MKKNALFIGLTVFTLITSACRENIDVTDTADAVKITSENSVEVSLSDDFLNGIWIDEDGFVCEYSDGVFTDSSGNRSESCSLINGVVSGSSYSDKNSWSIKAYENDVIMVDGIMAVRAESRRGEEFSAELHQRIQGKWITANAFYDTGVVYEITGEHLVLKSDAYGIYESDNKLKYDFTNSAMLFVYEDIEELGYETESILTYIRMSGEDTLSMLFSSQSYITELYRENSDTAELAIKNAKDASSRLIGGWIRISEGETEKWLFGEDGKAAINGIECEYTAIFTDYDGIELTVNDNEYLLADGGNSIFYFDNGTLYAEDSAEAKNALRMLDIEISTQELLKAYPDKDDWIHKENCGDIPLLADPDYIKKSIEAGVFEIGTPEQLASYCYYMNTQYESLPAVFTADIDISGYEWAPMGWESEYPLNPFNTLIFGEGFTISGLTINSDSSSVGFLGWSVGASVRDLNIVKAAVTGAYHAGIMNGQAIMSSFENCYVEGVVTASGGGSLLGHSTSTTRNCTADVIVNGKPFDFLTYNEKERSEIVIEEPVVITIDEETTVYRPEVVGYTNLGWQVLHDGEQVLHRNAETEYSYTYYGHYPGKYEICLLAYVSGQYAAVSNTVSYTISDSGELIIEDAVPVRFVPIAESPDYLNHVIDNPHTITIDENYTVTRPDLSEYDYGNMMWVVCMDGKEVMSGGSAGELDFKYKNTVPGFYEIYFVAFIGKGYVPVSNIVSYTIG